MRRAFTVVAVLVILSGVAFAQSTTPTPAFDIADIRMRSQASGQMSGGVLRAGRYDLRNATMLDLITTAYGVDADAAVDAAGAARRSLQAGRPPGPQAVARLRADDRRGRRKLKPASAGDPECRFVPQTPPGPAQPNAVACRNITMEAFAARLRGIAGNAYLPNPVVDRTGLSGSWDFDFRWTPRDVLAQAGSDGTNLFDAIE